MFRPAANQQASTSRLAIAHDGTLYSTNANRGIVERVRADGTTDATWPSKDARAARCWRECVNFTDAGHKRIQVMDPAPASAYASDPVPAETRPQRNGRIRNGFLK